MIRRHHQLEPVAAVAGHREPAARIAGVVEDDAVCCAVAGHSLERDTVGADRDAVDAGVDLDRAERTGRRDALDGRGAAAVLGDQRQRAVDDDVLGVRAVADQDRLAIGRGVVDGVLNGRGRVDDLAAAIEHEYLSGGGVGAAGDRDDHLHDVVRGRAVGHRHGVCRRQHLAGIEDFRCGRIECEVPRHLTGAVAGRHVADQGRHGRVESRQQRRIHRIAGRQRGGGEGRRRGVRVGEIDVLERHVARCGDLLTRGGRVKDLRKLRRLIVGNAQIGRVDRNAAGHVDVGEPAVAVAADRAGRSDRVGGIRPGLRPHDSAA